MADLLPEFARQLGLTPEEARPALDAALAAVRRALDRDGVVALAGIGTFSADGGFEPEPGLIAVVNDDYAGLEPLAEPAPVVVPPVTSFPVVPAGERVPAAPPAPTAFVEFAPLVPAPRGDDNDTVDADLTAAMEGAWLPAPAPPVAPLETPTTNLSELARRREREDEVERVIPPPAAPFAATVRPSPSPARPVEAAASPPESRPHASPLLWALPVLALGALAVWWWMGRTPTPEGGRAAEAPALTGNYDETPELAAGGSPADSGAERVTPEPEASQAAPEEDGNRRADVEGATADTRVPAGTQPAEPDVAPAPPATEPPAETQPAPVRRRARPGAAPVTRPSPPPAARADRAAPAHAPALYGSGTVDPAAGGFTWVLNSTDDAEARAQVDRYRMMGFRASVLTAVVDGRRVHRVAVGQFSDIAGARATRHLLPPDAPADTWILRLDRTP